jgi:hypothetical protein
VDRDMTLKAFGTTVRLSVNTLCDRIRTGRLPAVERYRGGGRDDPRSCVGLVTEDEAIRFMRGEVLSALATKRMPGFNRRNWRVRFTRE